MKRALLLLAACGGAKQAPAPTPPAPAPAHAEAPPADAPAPKQEEVLAAIQKAMNDLAPAANACWAKAATERFDIEGEYEAAIDIGDHGAQVADANVRAVPPTLIACMHEVLAHYSWAPPLHGQSIRLPFKWTAPGGQSVIDRRLVDSHEQAGVGIAVLLDENNTGNAAASMFEVTIKQDANSGYRQSARAEVWYFLSDGDVSWGPSTPKPPSHRVHAGDIMYVPAGGDRSVWANTNDLRAVVVAVPGGREGSARAGALPTPFAQNAKVHPMLLPAAGAKKFGPATIYLDDSIVKKTPMAASILELPAGAKVPEHVHANETELLYVLEGSGTMTIAGTDVAVTPTSVIQIPPNTKHAFVAKDAVRSLQIYTPAGPEQRFKKKP